MSGSSLYYKHSGSFKPHSLITLLAISLVAGVVLGSIYGIIVYYMPIIYINVLLCIGMGMGLGLMVRWLAMRQHIRNIPVIAMVGLFTGLAAEYAAFVGWLLPVYQWATVIIDPREMAFELRYVADQGVWGFSKGDPVTGVFLYLFWLAEGLVIVVGATVMSISDLRKIPYCEECGVWLTEATTIGPLETIADAERVRGSLERGDFAIVGELKPLGPDSPGTRYADLELRECPSCDEMAVMTVRNAVVTIDKEGNRSRTDTPIVQRLLIDRQSSELIKQVTQQAVTPAAVAESKATEGAGDGAAS